MLLRAVDEARRSPHSIWPHRLLDPPVPLNLEREDGSRDAPSERMEGPPGVGSSLSHLCLYAVTRESGQPPRQRLPSHRVCGDRREEWRVGGAEANA
jgi:hypothetical protein